jgi:hypothetical protein
MALSANVIFDVRTTGSDTLNGGGFDPSRTAGMFTDGAATVATSDSPVFTSASYNFVAGDVGHWVYIGSGTNWLIGWYEIASVAANAATLKAAIGESRPALANMPCYNANTTAGCASVASPTGATWSIDYSQSDTARFSYTDLASAGAGLTVSSATTPFGRQMVGNMLVIASGTNFTAGNYIIASVAAVTFIATVQGAGNITSGVGASGVGGLGGAMATPGKSMQRRVTGNKHFFKSGTYTCTSSTPNIAGGPIQVAALQGGVSDANIATFIGWDTSRTVLNAAAARAVIHAGAVGTITLLETATSSTYTMFGNITVNGNTNANTTGASFQSSSMKAWNIHATNTTLIGIDVTGGLGMTAWRLTATACGGTAAIRVGNVNNGTSLSFCESYANTTHGFVIARTTYLYRCISSGNTGMGFNHSGGGGYVATNCVSYGNTTGGYSTAGADNNITWFNCIAEANGGNGWVTTAVKDQSMTINCAGYNNTGGDYNSAQMVNVTGFIAQSAGSFFTNAASGDFTLNGTAGRGALLADTGFPQLLPRGTTANYPSIGAAQLAGASGSSGGVNPFNGLIVSM